MRMPPADRFATDRDSATWASEEVVRALRREVRHRKAQTVGVTKFRALLARY